MRIVEDAGLFNKNSSMFFPKSVPKLAKLEDTQDHLELEQAVKMITKQRFGEHSNVTLEEKAHSFLVRPSSMSVLDDQHFIL